MNDIKKHMDEIRSEQLNQTQNSLPSIVEMGKNLAKTLADTVKSVAAGEGAMTAEDQANARLKICQACEFYVNERCTKCGCFMAVKTHLKAANCPVGKW